MCYIAPASLLHFLDPDLREILPVALLLSVALPALALEDDDFVGTSVPNHLRLYRGAIHRRRTHENLVIAVSGEQDFVERDRISGLDVERRDAQADSGFGPELLTTSLKYCVHSDFPKPSQRFDAEPVNVDRMGRTVKT